MPELQWKEDLELGVARMDATHREFVERYNALAGAGPDDFAARLDEFAAHTEAHFAQENRWMEAVGFPGCHRGEHDRVLAVVNDIRKRVAGGVSAVEQEAGASVGGQVFRVEREG